MYKHNERQMIMPEDFFLPFGGKLNSKNRWCRLAAIIPWAEVEDRYAKCFKEGDGQRAYSVRVALGSLIIQNRKSLSDRERFLLKTRKVLAARAFHCIKMVVLNCLMTQFLIQFSSNRLTLKGVNSAKRFRISAKK